MLKVTPVTFEEFKKEHYKNKDQDNLRLGQRFCDTFFESGQSDPKLFYEHDDENAIDQIYAKYMSYS